LPVLRSFPWRALAAPGAWQWVLAAAASTAIYQATFLYGVKLSGAALGTAVALGCAPFATGVFSWWWGGQRPGRQWLGGTAAAVGGCALILLPAGSVHIDPLGFTFAVVAGCCYGAYTVAAKRLLDTGAPTTASMATTLLIGGLLLSPFLARQPGHLVLPSTVALIVWMGVVGTAVAYTFFGRGLTATTAATAGTLSLAEPLTATLLGVVVLGEHLTPTAITGCTLLLAGLFAANFPARRRASSSTPPPGTPLTGTPLAAGPVDDGRLAAVRDRGATTSC